MSLANSSAAFFSPRPSTWQIHSSQDRKTVLFSFHFINKKNVQWNHLLCGFTVALTIDQPDPWFVALPLLARSWSMFYRVIKVNDVFQRYRMQSANYFYFLWAKDREDLWMKIICQQRKIPVLLKVFTDLCCFLACYISIPLLFNSYAIVESDNFK